MAPGVDTTIADIEAVIKSLQAESYDQPGRQCDMVMKGGITSGVVYPLRIAQLALTNRLRSIGGASAGVGLGADGAVMVSGDGGATWDTRGSVEGQVETLDVTDGRWHAATSHGVFESTDDGRTWKATLHRQP